MRQKFSKGYYNFAQERIRSYFSLNNITEYKYNKLKSFIISKKYLNELRNKLKRTKN